MGSAFECLGKHALGGAKVPGLDQGRPQFGKKGEPLAAVGGEDRVRTREKPDRRRYILLGRGTAARSGQPLRRPASQVRGVLIRRTELNAVVGSLLQMIRDRKSTRLN